MKIIHLTTASAVVLHLGHEAFNYIDDHLKGCDRFWLHLIEKDISTTSYFMQYASDNLKKEFDLFCKYEDKEADKIELHFKLTIYLKIRCLEDDFRFILQNNDEIRIKIINILTKGATEQLKARLIKDMLTKDMLTK
jgi:hypothetical protein